MTKISRQCIGWNKAKVVNIVYDHYSICYVFFTLRPNKFHISFKIFNIFCVNWCMIYACTAHTRCVYGLAISED